MKFRYNPYCSCSRCRAHGFMGPVVLITIGVLFLLDQLGHSHWMDFGSTWPALLIVIGLIMFLQHNASAEGHVPREWPGRPGQPMPPYPPPPPVVTPPPVPPAGSITPGTNWSNTQNPHDPEAHNG
jgi:LiaI-LiaF-like transmembrane region